MVFDNNIYRCGSPSESYKTNLRRFKVATIHYIPRSSKPVQGSSVRLYLDLSMFSNMFGQSCTLRLFLLIKRIYKADIETGDWITAAINKENA